MRAFTYMIAGLLSMHIEMFLVPFGPFYSPCLLKEGHTWPNTL